MSTLKALGIGLGLGAVLVSAVLAVALVSSSAPSRVSLLTVPGSKAAGVDGAIAVLAREGLQNHAKKLAVLHRQSAKFDGVNLDKVVNIPASVLDPDLSQAETLRGEGELVGSGERKVNLRR